MTLNHFEENAAPEEEETVEETAEETAEELESSQQDEAIADEIDDLSDLDFETLFGVADEDEGKEQQDEGEKSDSEGETHEEEAEAEAEEEAEAQTDAPYFDENEGVWYDPSGEKLLPQTKVNDIVGNARIKGRDLEDTAQIIEEQTGMSLKDVAEELRNQRVKDYAEERGMDPEEAKRYFDLEETNKQLSDKVVKIHAQQQQQQRMMQYNQEKEQYINNPTVKKYEKEIDELAQHGNQLGWTAAMNYVLGEKAVNGELAQNIQDTAQKRMQKTKKPQVSPESGGGTGYSEPSIPKELQFFAKELDVDPKEAFDEYQKIQKEKQKPFA